MYRSYQKGSHVQIRSRRDRVTVDIFDQDMMAGKEYKSSSWARKIKMSSEAIEKARWKELLKGAKYYRSYKWAQ